MRCYPIILRPGAVTRAALEAIVGRPLVAETQSATASPGQHPIHYAPSAKVCVVMDDELEAVAHEMVGVKIGTLSKKTWQAVKRQCTGQIGSLIELLQGRLSDHIMEIVTDREEVTLPLDNPVVAGLTSRGILQRVIEGCGFNRWRDIKPDKLRDWLNEQRTCHKIGIEPRNHYLSSFKEFCNWPVRDGHTPSNPVAFLQALKAKTDIRGRAKPPAWP